MKQGRSSRGFTIVELLIIIIVAIAILLIIVVAYRGIQERARNSVRVNHITAVQRFIEVYNVQNGAYPETTTNPKANWRAADVQTDDNCTNGSSQADWVPGIPNLPQSNPTGGSGVDGIVGCYLYVSNGEEYVLSAWNMIATPQSSILYRRLGFREFQTPSSTQFYTCNANAVGGATGGYDISKDYYKHSYTISNIRDCDETPPGGA